VSIAVRELVALLCGCVGNVPMQLDVSHKPQLAAVNFSAAENYIAVTIADTVGLQNCT